MESHFAFEERRLAEVLAALAIDAGPADVLGVDPRQARAAYSTAAMALANWAEYRRA
jgi:hypothetical protein